MLREPLVMVCSCDFAGRVRGKGFPVAELPGRMTSGVGWVPTNTMISCFGSIRATPFGTTGDLALVPDPATEVQVDFGDGSAGEHFFLGDIRELAGNPWMCCPRDFLRRGLAALKEETGLELVAAFEHEFAYSGAGEAPSAYGLEAFRGLGVFPEALMAALRAAGAEPETFLPEFGARQFEVTVKPAVGLAAADRAVVVREMARAVAARLGHRASFAPIPHPDGVGNGVHIHFSLRGADGRAAMYDAAAPLGLSAEGAAFVAGVMHHLPALCALTAPAASSYIRMRPNRWAPTTATLARQDRGASLRVCPGAGAAFNVEYRCADAAASPYLALGAVVWAGVDGVRTRRALPEGEGAALPRDLGAALDALEANAAAVEWLGPMCHHAYLMHKRGELEAVAGLDEVALCERYNAAY
jgi:glutamine synthetase